MFFPQSFFLLYCVFYIKWVSKCKTDFNTTLIFQSLACRTCHKDCKLVWPGKWVRHEVQSLSKHNHNISSTLSYIQVSMWRAISSYLVLETFHGYPNPAWAPAFSKHLYVPLLWHWSSTAWNFLSFCSVWRLDCKPSEPRNNLF